MIAIPETNVTWWSIRFFIYQVAGIEVDCGNKKRPDGSDNGFHDDVADDVDGGDDKSNVQFGVAAEGKVAEARRRRHEPRSVLNVFCQP